MPISHKALLKDVPFGRIKLRDDNPRTNEDSVMDIALSILRFGLVKDSVGIDEEWECWYGDTTTKAIILINEHPEQFVDDPESNSNIKYGELRELFLSQHNGVVPEVTQFHGLTFEEKLEYRIADNKSHEKAGWNIQKLKPQLVTLAEKGRDLSATGFPDHELKLILQDRVGAEPRKCDPEKQKLTLPNYEDDGTLDSRSSAPGDQSTSDEPTPHQTIQDWSEEEGNTETESGNIPYVVHLAFSTQAGAIAFLRENGFADVNFADNRRIVTVDMSKIARDNTKEDGVDGASN